MDSQRANVAGGKFSCDGAAPEGALTSFGAQRTQRFRAGLTTFALRAARLAADALRTDANSQIATNHSCPRRRLGMEHYARDAALKRRSTKTLSPAEAGSGSSPPLTQGFRPGLLSFALRALGQFPAPIRSPCCVTRRSAGRVVHRFTARQRANVAFIATRQPAPLSSGFRRRRCEGPRRRD